MKKLVVIVLSLSIVFTGIFAQGMNVSAQTSAMRNQKKLIRYIKRNGAIKFKYHDSSSTTKMRISATSSRIKFYAMTKTTACKITTTMTVKKSNYPIAKIKFKYTDPKGYYMKAHKSVYCSTFKPGKKYDYYIKSNYPMTNSQINSLMRKLLKVDFTGWKRLIKKSSVTMKKIGFKKIK